jgi:hypothetical protein
LAVVQRGRGQQSADRDIAIGQGGEARLTRFLT